MKRCILFLLFNISWLVLSSQEFAEKDAEYVYNLNAAFSNGITKIKYSRDTLIDNRECRILNRTMRRVVNQTTDTINLNLPPFYISSKNGLIEFSNDGSHFDTLYYFSGSIGDSWSVASFFHRKYTPVYTILDTFRTEINGHQLFTQEIGWSLLSSPDEIGFIDTVYENIGSKWDYMDPNDWQAQAVDSGVGGVLRCFSNDLLGTVDMMSPYVPQYYNYECGDEITPVNDHVTQDIDVLIYPNPTSDILTIDWEGMNGTPIKILDIHGKSCVTTKLKFGKNTVDLSEQTTGVYFISSKGKLLSKVIVNR